MVHEIWTLDAFSYLIYEEYVVMTFISYLYTLKDEYWAFETSLHFLMID
jgi:hypothetical protein